MINLWVHLGRTHGSKNEIAEFEALLEPPSLPIPGRAVDGDAGAPSWYGSDEDAWESFQVAERRAGTR